MGDYIKIIKGFPEIDIRNQYLLLIL